MKLLLQYGESKKVREISDSSELHNIIQLTFGLEPASYFLQKYDQEFEDFLDIEDVPDLMDKDRIKILPLKQPVVSLHEIAFDNSLTFSEEPVAVESVSNIDFVPAHSKQWPQEIQLPVGKFSKALIEDLHKEQSLSWDKSRELVGHLANYAYSFKPYPNKKERLDICHALVTQYPYLRNNIGVGGIGGWELKLLNKLKKLRQTDTSLEVRINRHITRIPGTNLPKHLNVNPKKGELNWSPDHVPGETADSVKLHKRILLDEFRKSEKHQDKGKITSLMSLTYSFRREQINSNISVSELKSEYPIFFQLNEQFEEFERLTAVAIKSVFYEEVKNQGPELYRIFKNKKKSAAKLVLLNNFDKECVDMTEARKIEAQNSFGIFILPHLLRDDIDSLFKVVEERNKNTKRKTWDKQSMIHAVQAVRDGAVGYLAASRMFKVPKITLRRYVRKEKVEPLVLVNTPLGRKPYAAKDLEDSSPEGKANWSKENMIKAVLCVRSGRLGYAKAGKLFKVPYLTLRWYVKNAKIDLSTEKGISLESMSELTEMMNIKRQPSKRKLWDKQSMINAINAVRDGAVGYLAASKMFDVPKVTLRRYVKLENFDPSELIDKSLGRKPVMPQNLQEKLARYCIEMDEMFFGLKGPDVLKIANQLATQNNISTSFQNESAGRTWLHNFMKKYPDLHIRTNRNAYDRSKKLFRENIPKFLEKYEPMYEKVGRQPHRIFSVDDIGLCVVEDDPERVIRLRDIKEYSTFSDEEKNKLVTSIVCMNATGCFVPPLIVWPTKNVTKQVTNLVPPGSIWACHSSEWITANIFMMWFDHFIKLASPSSSNPALLLLDGRKPYVRNIEILDKAKENSVFIVSLPPNSAQLLQPLEVSFMNSFKTHYTSETESYLDSLSDEYKMQNTDFVKPARIAKNFSMAYNKAEAEQATEKAFEKIGLCPLMPLIFLSSGSSRSCPSIKTEPIKTEIQD